MLKATGGFCFAEQERLEGFHQFLWQTDDSGLARARTSE